MGEYAEMMLDGTCCEGCGEWLGDGDGYPQYCGSCLHDSAVQPWNEPEPVKAHLCDICGKSCKSPEGVRMHKAAKHPVEKVQCKVCGEWKAGQQGVENHQASGACERVLANKAGRPKRHVAPIYDDFDVIDDEE